MESGPVLRVAISSLPQLTIGRERARYPGETYRSTSSSVPEPDGGVSPGVRG